MKIKTAVLKYRIDDNLPVSYGHKLRGFFANQFADKIFHQHHKSGASVYRYPLIQYKIIRGQPLIIALEKGCDKLVQAFIGIEKIKLADKIYNQPEGDLKVNHCHLSVQDGELNDYTRYEFITPWLGLNQKNYDKYKTNDWNKDRENEFLSQILVGNILSFAKGVDWWVEKNISIVAELEKTTTYFKGQEMIGFTGTFFANITLPHYIGLGQATSRGFGTINKHD